MKSLPLRTSHVVKDDSEEMSHQNKRKKGSTGSDAEQEGNVVEQIDPIDVA